MINATVVFIDSSVTDRETLQTGVVEGVETSILNPNHNGIEQITAVLQQHPQVNTIHIVAHGTPGCLYLGNSQLNLENLQTYKLLIANWNVKNILLYSCNLAAGDAGEEFIRQLYQITNATISASTTKTGNAVLGGNWELEITLGKFTPNPVFTAAAMAHYAGVLAAPVLVNKSFTVNEGSSIIVTNSMLRTTDADNTDAQLIYTLKSLPTNGTLRLNGVNLALNSKFTQDDINNNRLSYIHNGSETIGDSFNFVVVDDATTTTRISTTANGTQGNGGSWDTTISADGRYAVFTSEASNLVSGDTNGSWDIFLKDLTTNTITRVSTSSTSTQGNSDSYHAAMSTDGHYVVFTSDATNLVIGDTNNTNDVFVKDLTSNTITRVSTNASGIQGNSDSGRAAISADGRYVVFQSNATNLVSGDTNGSYDIFVKDLTTNTITRVSTASNGTQGNGSSELPTISSDGRYVVFTSNATNLVSGDTNNSYDVFVKDLTTNTITRVSTASNGTQGNIDSGDASISANGRYVVFESTATNLVSNDYNYTRDVFVKDLTTGITTRVSTAADGTEGDGYSEKTAISADGRYVVFSSLASNLVSGDTNNDYDVFVKDLLTNTITRVSTASNGTEGDALSGRAAISSDGHSVVFASDATNLVSGDTNSGTDVFLSQHTGTEINGSVTITINPVNETPTNITLSNSTVAENQVVGTVVGNFSTSDPDIGNTFTYSLVTGTGSTDNALLTIVGNQLKTNGVFNFETKNSYSIRVRTTDQSGLFLEKALAIAVSNVNETPTNITLSNSTVAENQVVGTVVGNFSTSDPDIGNTFTYSLATGTGSTDNALFTIVGNQLKTNGVFNFETKNSYSIRVRTTDQNGLFFEKALAIAVSNVNETPTNLTISNTSIAENQALGTVIGNFTTTDPDTGNTFTYSLVTGTGSTDNASFSIVGNQLKANAVFDFETKNSYSIRVRTTDQGGLYSEKQLTIGITNTSEPPKITPTIAALSYIENGTTVIDPGITVTDLDSTNLVSAIVKISAGFISGQDVLKFTNQNGITGSYNSTTGVLTLTGSATLANYQTALRSITYTNSSDNPKTTTRTISFQTNDGSLNSSLVTRNINITAVNDAPVLVNKSFTVNEGSSIIVTNSMLLTTDVDNTNAQLIYNLTSLPVNGVLRLKGVNLADNGTFSQDDINNNRVTYIHNGSETTTDSFNFFVSDGAIINSSVAITVNPVNETPTNITLSNSKIAENQAVGTVVGNFTTTDSDVANTFTYSLVTGTGSTDNASFTIVGNQLKTNAAFNFEAKNSYSIRVRTTDQSGLFFEKALTIGVNNVNETPTNLTISNTTIAENLALGTVVGNFSTTDPDVGNTFTYSLVSGTGSTNNASFTIVGNQLKTNSSVIYNNQNTYNIRVRTTDQGGLYFEKPLTIQLTPVPTLAGTWDTTLGNAYGVQVLGNYAYLADGTSGLQIINISNPASPTLIGNYDTSGTAYGVQVVNNYAYVADHESGLEIINITNPASPVFVGNHNRHNYSGFQTDDVQVVGNYAYAADGLLGLEIINISNPNSPTRIGSYNTLALARAVQVVGNYAYVASDFRGLTIINISNPSSLTKTGSYETSGYAFGVAVVGSYAYVAASDAGLQIINISNPAAPTLKGSYQTSGIAYGVKVVGNYAYVAAGDSGLEIINISNPAVPTLKASYNTSGSARGLQISGNYAYVADDTGGLKIINVSQFENYFTTTSQKDTINTQAGNDTVTSTFANLQQSDSLNGGISTDTLIITGGTATNSLTINANSTTNQIANITGTTVLGFEYFDLSQFAGAVNFTGTAGNDLIKGGVGADTLKGGLGNDYYYVNSTADSITENLNEGTDLVYSTVTYTLTANVENLTLQGTTAINGTGNELNNSIIGNAGVNTLTGGAGADTLTGGLGNDSLYVGADTVVDVVNYVFGDGADTITQFVRGVGGDQIKFTGMTNIDVFTSGTSTQLRVSDGLAGNVGFGTGQLLATLSGTTGFIAADVNVNLFGANFLFS